jgi:hypothetical protein
MVGYIIVNNFKLENHQFRFFKPPPQNKIKIRIKELSVTWVISKIPKEQKN